MSFLLALALIAAPGLEWRSLGRGVEHATITLQPRPSLGDGALHVVRIDPTRARLRAFAAGQAGGKPRTARQWLDDFRLVAVINAGMFETDHATHTGFFRLDAHVNSSKWVKSYRSLLLLGAKKVGTPAVELRDLAVGVPARDDPDYGTVVQNLRLIRAPGVNVWKENGKRWSEAAIALDRDGKLLFLFCRSPFSMYDFNELLLTLPLGIVRAFHVEGGPEASLSLRGGGLDLDLSGSFETGFNESDDNQKQWVLPNVIGVEAER